MLRQFIVPIDLEREAHPDGHALLLQNIFCLLRYPELLVPVRIRRHNDLHVLSFQRRVRLFNERIQRRMVVLSGLHRKMRQKFNVSLRPLDR